jgi:hypothetical protein
MSQGGVGTPLQRHLTTPMPALRIVSLAPAGLLRPGNHPDRVISAHPAGRQRHNQNRHDGRVLIKLISCGAPDGMRSAASCAARL